MQILQPYGMAAVRVFSELQMVSTSSLRIFFVLQIKAGIFMVKAACVKKDVVLLHWQPYRGLVMTPSAAENVTSLSASTPALSQRQEGAGAQILFDYMLVEAGLKKDQSIWWQPVTLS